MHKIISLVVLSIAGVLGSNALSATGGSFNEIFVINSPSAASRGADSILSFNARGKSTVFFGAEHNITGLRDLACNPQGPGHIVVSRSQFSLKAAGFLLFDSKGRIIHTIPAGPPGTVPALAFDPAGNFYVAENQTVFKNDIALAILPFAGIGQIAVDSLGNVYLTDPFVSPRVFRIDRAGRVDVFADASQGLAGPYGLAIDSEDNIFVANNPGSPPAFILKFDSLGTPTSFASNISFQPGIASMTFDRHGDLYAALSNTDTILKFNHAGEASVFADASDGLDLPLAITTGPSKRNGIGGCL